MACVDCSFNSFSTKSHENYVFLYPFSSMAISPQIMIYFNFILVICMGWQVWNMHYNYTPSQSHSQWQCELIKFIQVSKFCLWIYNYKFCKKFVMYRTRTVEQETLKARIQFNSIQFKKNFNHPTRGNFVVVICEKESFSVWMRLGGFGLKTAQRSQSLCCQYHCYPIHFN